MTKREHPDLRICNWPDRIKLPRRMPRWPSSQITWSITSSLPEISPADQRDAFEKAWRLWEDVSGIRPVYVSRARLAQVRFHATIAMAGTSPWILCDPPANVGVAAAFEILLNCRAPWVVTETLGPGQANLVGAAAHGVGHALGITHVRSGNVMSPACQHAACKLGMRDVLAIVRRYGEPRGFGSRGCARQQSCRPGTPAMS